MMVQLTVFHPKFWRRGGTVCDMVLAPNMTILSALPASCGATRVPIARKSGHRCKSLCVELITDLSNSSVAASGQRADRYITRLHSAVDLVPSCEVPKHSYCKTAAFRLPTVTHQHH
jgi:hypothetical protein